METLPVNYVAQMSEVLKLLGNVQRLRIIEFLDLRGESAVSEIVEGVAGRQGAVSQERNALPDDPQLHEEPFRTATPLNSRP